MSLHDHLIRQIAANGPMRLDEYMNSCLLHPEWGYYTTRQPFGAQGDFTTAPEISQMFGELIGLCLAQVWLDLGRPRPFTLAEAGPGRGTLMADALRACRGVPGFIDAADITLIEASPALQATQRDALKGYDIRWIDSFAALPDQPLLLIANEFFDALPIRQFNRTATGWRERQIGAQDGRLCFGLGPELPQPALDARLSDTVAGDTVERCSALPAILQEITSRIAIHGGAALIMDYGDWRSLGDTMQALRNHAPADPLEDPGSADLTAHVDFEALALAAAPCKYTRLTPQGVFLERLGITERAQALARNLSAEAHKAHVAAHRRLTHPAEMGNLFKVLGLYRDGCAPPPGLEP